MSMIFINWDLCTNASKINSNKKLCNVKICKMMAISVLINQCIFCSEVNPLLMGLRWSIQRSQVRLSRKKNRKENQKENVSLNERSVNHQVTFLLLLFMYDFQWSGDTCIFCSTNHGKRVEGYRIHYLQSF